uniref:Uncharacterized protein n=1 Tax=Anguilla anguilla TaxID=7936 RepID=A0A0E9WVS7_ANGAN
MHFSLQAAFSSFHHHKTFIDDKCIYCFLLYHYITIATLVTAGSRSGPTLGLAVI